MQLANNLDDIVRDEFRCIIKHKFKEIII